MANKEVFFPPLQPFPVRDVEKMKSELGQLMRNTIEPKQHTSTVYDNNSPSSSEFSARAWSRAGESGLSWRRGQGNMVSFLLTISSHVDGEDVKDIRREYEQSVVDIVQHVAEMYTARAYTEYFAMSVSTNPTISCSASYHITLFYAPGVMQALPDRDVMWRSMCAYHRKFRSEGPCPLRVSDLGRALTIGGATYVIYGVIPNKDEPKIRLKPFASFAFDSVMDVDAVKALLFETLPDSEKDFMRKRMKSLEEEEVFYDKFRYAVYNKLFFKTTEPERELLESLSYEDMLVLDDEDYMLVGIDDAARKNLFRVRKIENGAETKWNAVQMLRAIEETRAM